MDPRSPKFGAFPPWKLTGFPPPRTPTGLLVFHPRGLLTVLSCPALPSLGTSTSTAFAWTPISSSREAVGRLWPSERASEWARKLDGESDGGKRVRAFENGEEGRRRRRRKEKGAAADGGGGERKKNFPFCRGRRRFLDGLPPSSPQPDDDDDDGGGEEDPPNAFLGRLRLTGP